MKHGSWLSLRDLRLLLGEAVNCAHAPDERFAIDRNHASIGEDAL